MPKDEQWKDIGCADFVRAAANRIMVARGQNIIGYLEVESALRRCPRNKPLPAWIPLGNMPKIGKGERNALYQHGMHEIEG